MKTFRTLFSGGELFGVGARWAGWRHVDGYEIRSDIAAVARQNGFDVKVADVCEIDYESLAPVDHLHVSPSCKNASVAKTDGGETQEDLDASGAICRAIRAHAGQGFSLENVWGYRNFESFARILACLHACGFVVDFRHVNAADFGVPQTRKRLILRAVRGRDRVPPLHPTHRRGGDMFHLPWVGWYAAIEDILDTLPESEFAPWQLARLPIDIAESTIFSQTESQDRDGNNYGYGAHRSASEPMLTVSTMTPGWWKALIVGGGNTQLGQVDSRARFADEPMFTVAATDGAGKAARAFLVGGQYARNNDDPDRRVQTADGASPSWTVTPGSAKDARAFLVDGGHGGVRFEEEPASTVVSDDGSATVARRAWLARGRVVKMTVRALARFQTVPDEYVGPTAEINGNGVPCLLARRIMESLL